MSWAEVVDAAVIGVGRKPFGPDQSEARLLRAAAALSRARRAGYRAALAGDRQSPAPSERDDRPAVSLAAERRLAELLEANSPELIGQWLSALAPTGRRPPDLLLPALLTVATTRQELRAELLPALGPLAPWLAGFNAEWDWAATPASSPETDWATSGSAARRALLSRLRAQDPGAGRDLVASTWATDTYRDKTAFLEILRAGLSPGDEPLAEQALADRRAEVRKAAADLLVQLPASRYSQRAAARATAAVRVENRTLVIAVRADDRQLAADGLDTTPPRGYGIRAWLLRQTVATAPASLWTEHTGLEQAELLAIASAGDWAAPLRSGWTRAAIRDADVPWLRALLSLPPAEDQVDHLQLVKALPPAARDEWLSANLASPRFTEALELYRHPGPCGYPIRSGCS